MITQATELHPRTLADPPTPCLAKLNKLDWAPTRSFALADLYVGVRSSSEELDRRISLALQAHRADDIATAPNFSLLLADRTARGAGAGFNLLYRSSSTVVRTRDPRRLLHGLVAHLAGLSTVARELLQIQGVALVGPNGAVVAPVALHQWLGVVERRLNQRGVRLVDAPTVTIDPIRREVVVLEPAAIDVDWSAFEGIERLVPKSRPDPCVEPGRYPLTGWAFFVGRTDTDMPRARAVALAAQRTLSAYSRGLQPTLDALARVMRDIEPVGLPWTNPAAEAERLAELA